LTTKIRHLSPAKINISKCYLVSRSNTWRFSNDFGFAHFPKYRLLPFISVHLFDCLHDRAKRSVCVIIVQYRYIYTIKPMRTKTNINILFSHKSRTSRFWCKVRSSFFVLIQLIYVRVDYLSDHSPSLANSVSQRSNAGPPGYHMHIRSARVPSITWYSLHVSNPDKLEFILD
jgi:hypothetical protein